MKNEREDLIPPEEEKLPFTGTTAKAIARELELGGSPYKIAEYFGVPVKQVLAIQTKLRNYKSIQNPKR